MNAVMPWLKRHAEAAALAGLLLATVAIGLANSDGAVPLPVYLLGMVGGSTVALHAIGILLVYRSNRVINFAQIPMGVAAGLLFVRLVADRTFVRAISAVWPGAVPKPTTLGQFLSAGGGAQIGELTRDPVFRAAFGPETRLDDPRLLQFFPPGFSPREFGISAAPSWLVHVNYWLALLVGIAAAVGVLWLVYAVVVRRFSQAPKLVLTVITIAVGFFLQQVTDPLLDLLFGDPATGGQAAGQGAARLAPSVGVEVRPIVFSAGDLLTVAAMAAATAGIILFFGRSRVGIVMRGASENSERAETLGVNVNSVTARAWLIAGALSGAAAVLTVARTGAAPGAGGYDVLVRTLGAAVAGGLFRVPVTVAASLVVGIADSVTAWVFGSAAVMAGVLLAVIVVLLLVQRTRAGRADRDAGATWQATRELRPIPGVLRDLAQVRRTVRLAASLAAVVVLGFPWFMSPSQTNVGVITMIQAVIGLSLLVLTGWAGQISLGHMAFAALGAWMTVVLGWPFLPALLAGGLAGIALAVLIGIPSLKLRGLHLAISTLALGVAATAILFDDKLLGRHAETRLGRPMMLGIDFEGERAFYYLTLFVLLLSLLAVVGLRRSAVARTLIAAKDNEQTAMSFGINLLAARLMAFAVSGCMAAMAGVMFAYAQHGVDPLAYGPEGGVNVFLMTLLGGLGSVAGPVLGAFYLGGLRILSTTALGDAASIMLNPGLGVILLLILMPGGAAQGLYAVRDAWLRRLASRHRIEVPALLGSRATTAGPIPVLPKLRPSGGEVLVPKRFRLDGQWAVAARRRRRDKEAAGV